MASAVTDLLDRVTDSTTGRPVISALAAPGKALAAPSINLSDVTNWTTATGIHLSIYNTVSVAGVAVKDPTTQTDWKGTLAGTTISGLTLTGGPDRTYTAGAIVEITPTARYAKDIYEWGIAHANQDGTLKATAIQSALGLGSDALNGWNPLGYTFGSVTYNGNRSYTGVINGVDVTGTLSVGSKLKGVKTVSAPTQCASLNGTTQYFSKITPAGFSFTDDFVVGAWVKLASYPAAASTIISKYNGTSGFAFGLNSSGQVFLEAYNGSGVNFSNVKSYQSVPLNKWVHIAAQLDMSSFTASTTTSYVMLDGVDVPAFVGRGGTNPTSLLQAGNLEIGSQNGGAFSLNGKIQGDFVTSAKLTQTQARAIYSQGLTASDVATYSIISAHSLSGASGLTDINTTNANNLTAQASATTTTADAPYGLDDSGTPSATVTFGVVTSKSFSTNTTVTWQAPEGATWPTSGGVTTVYYSGQKQPFGFPAQRDKWQIISQVNRQSDTGILAVLAVGPVVGWSLNVPIGSYNLIMRFMGQQNPTSGNSIGAIFALSSSSSAISDWDLAGTISIGSSTTQSALAASIYRDKVVNLTTATPYYIVSKNIAPVTATSFVSVSDYVYSQIIAELTLI